MITSTTFVCFALCLLYGAIPTVDAAKILSIFAFPGPSQYIFGSALLKELAARGHEVTSISTFPQQQPVKNFRDIPILENLDLTKDLMSNMEQMHNTNIFEELSMLSDLGAKISDNVLKNAAVQQLLQSKTEQFDLVISEAFYCDALYGLAQHFDAPIIGIFTLGSISWVDSLVGNTSPISYVPHFALPYTSHMTFGQRLTNLALNIFEQFHYNYYHLSKQRALYVQHFPAAKVSLDVLLKSFSLVLLNQHFSLGLARPYVPNMIEVGGLHVKQVPDRLPADLQQLLDNATETGAIYFSLGSNIQAKDLPLGKLQIILNSLGALKQKVLWKFEDTSDRVKLPSNVYISKWFPQPSVLAHPNVKLFITHGGLLSTTESVFHAKPILGIPMFGDQAMNMVNAVHQGYALSMNYNNLNEPEFREKCVELLNNPRYTHVVRKLSKLLRDQPQTPLETAVFWTEYVLRHDGATHMRVAGQNLNFFQLNSLDTLGMLFGGVLLVLGIFIWLLRKLVCLFFVRGKRGDNLKSKQQ